MGGGEASKPLRWAYQDSGPNSGSTKMFGSLEEEIFSSALFERGQLRIKGLPSGQEEQEEEEEEVKEEEEGIAGLPSQHASSHCSIQSS